MPATDDPGRERELEQLGITEPTVKWLDNDRVEVTLRRTELDQLIADLNGSEDVEVPVDLDAYSDGHADGYAEAMRQIKSMAAAR